MNSPAEIHPTVLFILQLGVLIIATRIGGYWFRRWFHLPGVLGELLVGVVIGPYALGHFNWPIVGHLFTLGEAGSAISPELHAIATFAAIILLFISGLETDLSTFLRYSVVGTIIGIGGVVISFYLGAGCAVWFGLADSWLSPAALFLGTIATATSIGISARILNDRRKMGSAEGVTILSAAVFDDVIGIIILAIVVGMVRASKDGGTIAWKEILWISSKAFGFWIGATALGLLLARRFSQMLKYFKTTQAIAALALGFALLLAGLSEMAGLAMIIGAYIMGLSLSRTDIVQVIQREMESLENILVPVFFASMGMMVNLGAIQSVFKIGLVYSLFAIASKVLGCGIPALFCGFNRRGALRIGTGMLPRGEVALIIAGIGLTSGAIGQDIFGIAVMMTLITALIGPLWLSHSFKDSTTGLRKPEDAEKDARKDIPLSFASHDMADFMLMRIAKAFRQEEFYVYRITGDSNTYNIRKDAMFFTLESDGTTVTLCAPSQYETLARLIIAEEMLTLRSMLHMAQDNVDLDSMEHELISGLFGGNEPEAKDPP